MSGPIAGRIGQSSLARETGSAEIDVGKPVRGRGMIGGEATNVGNVIGCGCSGIVVGHGCWRSSGLEHPVGVHWHHKSSSEWLIARTWVIVLSYGAKARDPRVEFLGQECRRFDIGSNAKEGGVDVVQAVALFLGGPAQVFPPIIFFRAGDLIFRCTKTPKKTDRRQTKRGRFFDTKKKIESGFLPR